jgi:hypothetical protein
VTNQNLKEKIVQFWTDVAILGMSGISNNEIGEKIPGVGKANFSKYFNQTYPITEDFLAKFYETWGKVLEEKKENTAEEATDLYSLKDIIVEKLVDGQNLLINNNMKLVESNQKLIDHLLQRGYFADPPKAQDNDKS